MFDLILIIKTVGLIGIFLIIFAESGLFFGFFLPGDSLLFSSGLIASTGFFDINLLVIICIIAAVLGDSIGYWTGKFIGYKLFYKDTGFFFRKKRIEDAEIFYKKHGIYTIILARFIPIIRTFAPIVAGIGKMKYKIFLSYNIIGAVGWISLLTYSGYFLGKIIPNPDIYILPIIGLIVLMSLLPIFAKFFRKTHSLI